MLYVVSAIIVIVLISFPELLKAKTRGKLMGVYFTIIVVSLVFGILMIMDKQPVSLIVALMDLIKSIGWGEG